MKDIGTIAFLIIGIFYLVPQEYSVFTVIFLVIGYFIGIIIDEYFIKDNIIHIITITICIIFSVILAYLFGIWWAIISFLLGVIMATDN